MSDPGMTSEQRAAVAVHNATHARRCLASVNEQGWGQDGTLCQRCAEVADQIDAAVEVERQAAEERGRLQGQFSPLGDNHHNAAACPYCGDLLTKAEERGRRTLREKIVKALGCAATASDDDLARGAGSLVLAVHDLNRKCRHLTEDLKSREERGRRSGVEEAIQRFSEMAKPAAPKPCVLTTEEIITELQALAPRDSAPVTEWRVCDNCKRAQKAKDGRTDHGIPIGPCYCDRLRAPRDSGKFDAAAAEADALLAKDRK